MKKPTPPSDIEGYHFAILVRKGEERGYVAACPGVGGVFVEGPTIDAVVQDAVETACAVLDARARNGHLLTKDNQYLRIIRRPHKAPVAVRAYTDKGTYGATCLLAPSC